MGSWPTRSPGTDEAPGRGVAGGREDATHRKGRGGGVGRERPDLLVRLRLPGQIGGPRRRIERGETRKVRLAAVHVDPVAAGDHLTAGVRDFVDVTVGVHGPAKVSVVRPRPHLPAGARDHAVHVVVGSGDEAHHLGARGVGPRLGLAGDRVEPVVVIDRLPADRREEAADHDLTGGQRGDRADHVVGRGVPGEQRARGGHGAEVGASNAAKRRELPADVERGPDQVQREHLAVRRRG
jgi:hypothetical protein